MAAEGGVGLERSVWLWCPAYPLAAPQVAPALTAAAGFATALDATLHPSPLLDRHGGPGAWLPADTRRDDLTAGRDHGLLLAARGGYGCLDLLAGLDRPLPPVVGYSDLTVLHAAQAVLGGRGGLYGFMPGVGHGERASDSAIALARGEGQTVADLPGSAALRPGHADGPLFAACLRVLTGLCGSRWMPRLAGRILALEDIDERPYRIDRDLFQLHASGALDGIAGLVFGTFPADLPAGYAGPSARDVCAAWATRLGVPAVWGLPFGHDPDPLTLAMARPTSVTVGENTWSLAQASTPTPLIG